MAVIYSPAIRTARMKAVLSAIGPNGKLEIGTAGMSTVLATVPLDTPAGSVSGDVLTIQTPLVDSSAADSGTAAEARIRTSADTDVITGLTVGLSAADIILDDVAIVAGNAITITTAEITHNTG